MPEVGSQVTLVTSLIVREDSLTLYGFASEESRTLFKVLCQEEAKHKLALETMYDDYMAEMGD